MIYTYYPLHYLLLTYMPLLLIHLQHIYRKVFISLKKQFLLTPNFLNGIYIFNDIVMKIQFWLFRMSVSTVHMSIFLPAVCISFSLSLTRFKIKSKSFISSPIQITILPENGMYKLSLSPSLHMMNELYQCPVPLHLHECPSLAAKQNQLCLAPHQSSHTQCNTAGTNRIMSDSTGPGNMKTNSPVFG